MLTNKLLTAVRKTVLMVLLTASFAAAGDAQNVLWKNRFNGAGDNSDRYNQAVADGGTIAFVRDGDMISIDVINGILELDVSDDVLAERKRTWVAPKPPVQKGSYLERYSRLVGSAMSGAILK